jgi:signal transduction histidine kinase
MKVNFASRINTALFVYPLLFIIAVYFYLGAWLYFAGASSMLKDFHAAQLMTMLSDKKNGLEIWFDFKKRSAEEISRSPVVLTGLPWLTEKKTEKKETEGPESADKMGRQRAAALQAQKLSGYLADLGQFRTVSFLNGNGSVIWSTNPGLKGKELLGEEFLKTVQPGRAFAAAGNISGGMSGKELFFAAAVAVKGGKVEAIVIAQPDPADLAASLRVEPGFYQTGRVAIIDDNGMVVASKDMTDVRKIRFNVPQGEVAKVDYRDGFFFIVSPLKFEGLRLIATLDASEAAKPLGPMFNVYLAFAGIMLFVLLLQVTIVAPRIISRPLDKLLKAMEAVGEGDLRAVSLRKGFMGEWELIVGGFSKMVVSLSRKKTTHEKVSGMETADRSKVLLAEVLIVEARVRLEGIRKNLDLVMSGKAQPGRDIPDIAGEAKALTETIDSLNLLIRIKDGSAKLALKKCEIRDIFREAEEECRSLLGGKEIELIVDFHVNLDDKTVNSDPKVLKKMISALLRNAIRVTDIGTITLLASYEERDGVKYLEIALSDTGRGVDRQSIEWVLKEGTFPSQNLDLGIAREFAEELGGQIAMESLQNRGSVVTILIPLKGSMPKNETKKKS